MWYPSILFCMRTYNKDEAVTPRHRGLGGECTTSVHFLGRARDRIPPPTGKKSRHCIKIETRGKFGIWKRNKSTSTPARERPLTRVRARSKIWPTNWTRSQARKDEYETQYKGCGLRKREKNMRGKKDRHEAFPRMSCSMRQDRLEPCFIKCYPSSHS